MEYSAIILGSLVISRSGILLCLSGLSGCCLFFSLQRRRTKYLYPAALVALVGLLLALPFSRLIHWYSNTSQYASFALALTDYSKGGFASVGVFAAFLLSALVFWLLGIVPKLAPLLDDLSCAGALSAAIGKLACGFSLVCRSKFSFENPALRRLPFMISSTLSTGAEEWRIATFALQAIAYFLICLLSLCLIKSKKRAGDSFALTLSLIGAIHVVLDSTRYDAVYLRSNGFVSITQICCVVALLATAVYFSLRGIKEGGRVRKLVFCWLLWVVCAGVGGYCEYYVQRHAGLFLPTYALMELCFLACFALNWYMSNIRAKKATAVISDEQEPSPAP